MFWSADCAPNEVKHAQLTLRFHRTNAAVSPGQNSCMVLIITYRLNSVTLSFPAFCQDAFNSVCLPVRGRISSATAILRLLIILRNDVSMPSCRITKGPEVKISQRRWCCWFHVDIMQFRVKTVNDRTALVSPRDLLSPLSPSWAVDSHAGTHTSTNTHINRGGLSGDPLFADQMTVTVCVGRRRRRRRILCCYLSLYGCHSSHKLVFGANRS